MITSASRRAKAYGESREGKWLVLGLLAILAAAVIAPRQLDDYETGLFVTAGILALLAVSWNIMGGLARLLSLGHAAFMGIGAYVAANLLAHDVGPVPAMAIAALSGAIVSIALIPAFRVSGIYFAILTLAMAEGLLQLARRTFPGGDTGMFVKSSYLRGSNGPFVSTLVCVSIAFLVTLVIKRSRLGDALLAVRGDPDVAASLGVNVLSTRAAASAISGALAGLAGGLYATTNTYIDPVTVFDANFSILPVLATILGGIGTLWGPLIGAVSWFALSEWVSTSTQDPSYSLLLYGAVLVALALFLPQGIVGKIQALRHSGGPRSRTPDQLKSPEAGDDGRRTAEEARERAE